MGPLSQYQVPEPVGKGNVQVGIAGGGAVRTDFGLGIDKVWGITSDLWADIGVGRKWDVRVRFSNYLIIDFRPEGDVPSFDILGLDIQLKRSNSSGNSAFLVGIQPQLIIDVVGDETRVGIGAPAVYFGGVFGFGDQGGVRFLLTSTAAAAFGGTMFGDPVFWIQLALSSGLEIPVADSVFLRPELTVHLIPVVIGDGGGAVVMATLGTAVVF